MKDEEKRKMITISNAVFVCLFGRVCVCVCGVACMSLDRSFEHGTNVRQQLNKIHRVIESTANAPTKLTNLLEHF